VKATICDVGPRDGLQDEPEPPSVPARAELVNRLAAVGVPRIEAASFVHPERVPQMAGAEEVAVGIEPLDGTIYAGLVPNEKGYDRLATTALDEVHFSFGASVGGLGGCPFAPRATGNIATEDLVYLLHGEGVPTGIDLEGLIAVAAWLEETLGRELPGRFTVPGPSPPWQARVR
jgi:isopropylmalate/homocitrate/citramalate synthase